MRGGGGMRCSAKTTPLRARFVHAPVSADLRMHLVATSMPVARWMDRFTVAYWPVGGG